MATTMLPPEDLGPGVRENPYGGYHIHVVLDDGSSPVLGGTTTQDGLAPPDAPVLAGKSVFEDVVVLDLRDGQSLVLHVTDPTAESVLFFYRANGTLRRAAPLEQLNPGWVLGQYHFRGDLAKFDTRLVRMRRRFALPKNQSSPTFWWTGGWQSAVVYTAQGIVESGCGSGSAQRNTANDLERQAIAAPVTLTHQPRGGGHRGEPVPQRSGPLSSFY